MERLLSIYRVLSRKESGHEGTRTLNLPIRSRTAYPLGHAANNVKVEIFNAMHYIQGEIKTIILQIFMFAREMACMPNTL